MATRQTRTTGAPARRGEPSAPERWLANIRLSSFTIMIMALVILGVIVLAPSLKLLIEQRSQIASLQQSVDAAKQHVSGLKTQVARWDDPAYIEAQARNRLLFVFPGDYSYLIIPNTSATTTRDGAPISKHIQNTQVDWVKSLTASIFSAGLSDQTVSKLGKSGTGTGSSTIVSPGSSGAPALNPGLNPGLNPAQNPAKDPGMTGVGQ